MVPVPLVARPGMVADTAYAMGIVGQGQRGPHQMGGLVPKLDRHATHPRSGRSRRPSESLRLFQGVDIQSFCQLLNVQKYRFVRRV